jgi:hypothetical protein
MARLTTYQRTQEETPGGGNHRAPGNRSADHACCLSILAAASTGTVGGAAGFERPQHTLPVASGEVRRPH